MSHKEEDITFTVKANWVIDGNGVFIKEVKRWRPLNWDEERFYVCMELTEGGGAYKDIYEVFEAGADALYDAFCDKIDNDEFIHKVLQHEGDYITTQELRDWLKGVEK